MKMNELLKKVNWKYIRTQLEALPYILAANLSITTS